MEQIAGKPRDRAVGEHVLVHGIVAPARAAAIEQAHVPVGIAFAVREPAAEKAVAARERVGESARRRHLGGDRRRHLRGYALVRIEAEHPVVRRRADREILLRSEPRPTAIDDARTAAPRDFHGIIAAARIDDDHVAGERRRREALRDLAGGVARDHTKTQGKRPGHARSVMGSLGSAL